LYQKIGEDTMRLEEIFASVLSEPISNITDFSSPKNLKSWNSLRHIQIVTTIENTYKVRFTTAEIVTINSVGDIRQILSNKGIKV
jgi:acyl carrier protein